MSSKFTSLESQYWVLKPNSASQQYGYCTWPLNTTNSSPTVQRMDWHNTVDTSTLPLSSSDPMPTPTIPGCWNITDDQEKATSKHSLQASPQATRSLTRSRLPWKPGPGQQTPTMTLWLATVTGLNLAVTMGIPPHSILMVTSPNPADSSLDALTHDEPTTNWRHWGIGFAEDANGTPVIHWGGWKTKGGGNKRTRCASRRRPRPHSSAVPIFCQDSSNNNWAHVVGIFHSRTEVQLFYNGREVAYYKDDSFTKPGVDADRTQVDFNSGGNDNRVPDIATYNYTDDQDYNEGVTAWCGGVCWWNHVASGPSAGAHHSNFAYVGRIAAPAIYRRALTSKEVMDHYLTMRQGSNIHLKGEAKNYVTLGGTAGEEQGVISVDRSLAPGQRNMEAMIVRSHELNAPPDGTPKNLPLYAGESMQIDARAGGALRTRYFYTGIERQTSGDARYDDRAITGFDPPGYGLITTFNPVRWDGAGGATNNTAVFFDLTGASQYLQDQGTDTNDNLGGFQVGYTDTGSGEIIYFRDCLLSHITAGSSAYVAGLTYATDDVRTQSQRITGTTYGFTHDPIAYTVGATLIQPNSLKLIPADPEVGLLHNGVSPNFTNTTLRTDWSGGGIGRDLTLLTTTDGVGGEKSTLRIGPTALLMNGDFKEFRRLTRAVAGYSFSQRTRLAANTLRRHCWLKRINPQSRTKMKIETFRFETCFTVHGSISLWLRGKALD